MTQNFFQTLVRNELSNAAKTVADRGSRWWSSVEIMAPTWFVVEACIEDCDESEIRRWATASIHKATQIQHSLKPYRWSKIYVFMRAPLSIKNATIFEVVAKAYQVGHGDSYLYQLENGMSFVTNGGPAQAAALAPNELNLVYSQCC